MTVIKNRFISHLEIDDLLWETPIKISARDLSKWIKSKTNDEFVVVPRSFCLNTVTLLEEVDYYFEDYEFCKEGEKENYLKQIKAYL